MRVLQIPVCVASVFGFILLACLTAPAARADFTFSEPVNLRSVIPTIDPAHDSVDCISTDRLEIYIESDRADGQGDWDIWVLRRSSIDEQWGLPENCGMAINSPNLDSDASISPDGLTLYFGSSRTGGYGSGDIYVTTRPAKDAPWGQAVNMGPQINSSSADNCPRISADGLEFFFASTRPGGLGGWDLYVSQRATTNDSWGEPVNLGPAVNGTQNELNVCLSPDGQVLFFSDYTALDTPRPGGYGGSDMWMTRRETLSGLWQTPVNLGPMLNSAAHELMPRVWPDGSFLCFSTNSGGSWENWQSSILPVVDFNGDGTVDAIDIDIMIDCWGTDDSLCDIGPMPWGDGVVDVEDLVVLVEHIVEARAEADTVQ